MKQIKQGWECPKCKAVMSPDEKICVNCKGNTHAIPVILPEIPQDYPFIPPISSLYAVPSINNPVMRYSTIWRNEKESK